MQNPFVKAYQKANYIEPIPSPPLVCPSYSQLGPTPTSGAVQEQPLTTTRRVDAPTTGQILDTADQLNVASRTQAPSSVFSSELEPLAGAREGSPLKGGRTWWDVLGEPVSDEHNNCGQEMDIGPRDSKFAQYRSSVIS